MAKISISRIRFEIAEKINYDNPGKAFKKVEKIINIELTKAITEKIQIYIDTLKYRDFHYMPISFKIESNIYNGFYSFNVIVTNEHINIYDKQIIETELNNQLLFIEYEEEFCKKVHLNCNNAVA